MRDETPDITKDTFEAPAPHPLVADLPPHLKDPKNYKKVMSALYEAGASKCDHSEVLEWSQCSKCQLKQHERAEMMRKLGFTSGAQFLAWRKIHETIISRVSLEKYNS